MTFRLRWATASQKSSFEIDALSFNMMCCVNICRCKSRDYAYQSVSRDIAGSVGFHWELRLAATFSALGIVNREVTFFCSLHVRHAHRGSVVVYLCARLFRATGTDVCAYTGCARPTGCSFSRPRTIDVKIEVSTSTKSARYFTESRWLRWRGNLYFDRFHSFFFFLSLHILVYYKKQKRHFYFFLSLSFTFFLFKKQRPSEISLKSSEYAA